MTRSVPSRAFSPPLVIGVLLTDALFKFIAHRWLPGDGVVLFPGVTLRVFENIRGPFGVLPLWLAIAVSMLTLLGFGSRWMRPDQARDTRLLRRSLSLLIGGGIANLAERLIFSRTTDILWLGDRAALNVADAAVLGGAFGLAIVFWSALTVRSERRVPD